MIRHSLALALAAAAAFAAPAALAQTEAKSIRVEYKDLNLSSEKGQEILERRLETAARKVCGISSHTTGTHLIRPAARKCYESARRDMNQRFAEVVSNSRRGG